MAHLLTPTVWYSFMYKVYVDMYDTKRVFSLFLT